MSKQYMNQNCPSNSMTRKWIIITTHIKQSKQ